MATKGIMQGWSESEGEPEAEPAVRALNAKKQASGTDSGLCIICRMHACSIGRLQRFHSMDYPVCRHNARSKDFRMNRDFVGKYFSWIAMIYSLLRNSSGSGVKYHSSTSARYDSGSRHEAARGHSRNSHRSSFRSPRVTQLPPQSRSLRQRAKRSAGMGASLGGLLGCARVHRKGRS